MDVGIGGARIDQAVLAKVVRLSNDHAPRVLDMFSGAGGISLGFLKSGFRIEGALEIDVHAARTHALNFHPSNVELHAQARDMTRIEPKDLIAELGLGDVETAIDVLVGGPPCQAYARVGRAKLREVAEHPDAYQVDPRGNLFLRYLAYVEALKPLAILMENVPDALRYGGHNIPQEMVEALDALGYDARYSLLNSAYYGCPQMRDRVYLVGYRKELQASIGFPSATTHITLPTGYDQNRKVVLRHVDMFTTGYVSPAIGDPNLSAAVTAKEAIGDLPSIKGTDVERGTRRFSRDTWQRYPSTASLSTYARTMREWPGFESDGGVIDHAIRYLPRDHTIFAAMRQGSEYPEARRLALRIARERAAALGIDRRTKIYHRLRDSLVPPYDETKFANKWWKMREDSPVRTLMAHLSRDCYSHIHYDDEQARTISVREAARLQGFPDGFVFFGTMNPVFKQIGNAVPPLVSAAIAALMKDTLSSTTRKLAAVSPSTPDTWDAQPTRCSARSGVTA